MGFTGLQVEKNQIGRFGTDAINWIADVITIAGQFVISQISDRGRDKIQSDFFDKFTFISEYGDFLSYIVVDDQSFVRNVYGDVVQAQIFSGSSAFFIDFTDKPSRFIEDVNRLRDVFIHY